MDDHSQIQILQNLPNPTEHDKLMLAALRLKERLSHLPCYANREACKSINFWKGLASSGYNLNH